MEPDDQVVVIGSTEEPGGNTSPTPARRRVRALLAPLVIAVAVVIGIVAAPEDAGVSEVDPSGLSPPSEPLRFEVSTEEDPQLGTGWRHMNLLGSGWTARSVDHGPAGWLAVTATGTELIVAHVSDDATTWTAHTVHGVRGTDPIAAVGDDLMAVVAGNPEGAPAETAAVSADRGQTWTAVPTPGGSLPQDAAVVGGRLYVLVSAFPYGDQRREVLVIDAGSFELLDLGGATATALLPGRDDSLTIYGYDDDGLVAWTVDETGSAVRFPVSPPDEGRREALIDVEALGAHYVALAGDRSVSPASGQTLWTSRDGLNWETTSEIAPRLRSIEPFRDELLGELNEGGGLWSSIHGTFLPSAVDDERQPVVQMTRLATDGERIVVVGLGLTGAWMGVHGTEAEPIERMPPPLDDSGARWVEVSSAPRADVTFTTGGFGAFTLVGDDATFVVVPGSVMRVSADGLLAPEHEFAGPLTGAGLGPRGLWIATSEGWQSTMHTFSGGAWSTEVIPLRGVTAVAELDGRLQAWGFGSSGPARVRQDDQGEWKEGEMAADWPFVVSVPGGVLAPAHELDTPVLRFSENGETWDTVDVGRVLEGLFPASVPFLRDEADPTHVALVDQWPSTTQLELPTPDALEIHRWEEGLVVRTPTALYVSDANASWTEYPLDLEHGVPGLTSAIPGPDPMVVSLGPESVHVLAWR